MDSVLRAAAIYLIVWVAMRLAGRRTLAEVTTFDFVLLLVIGEATQQALLGDDFSITNAAIIIVTLVVMDVGASLLRQRFKRVDRIMDGVPMILVQDGLVLHDRMKMARLDESDVLEAARQSQGLEHMTQIRLAVLEVGGAISIIPK